MMALSVHWMTLPMRPSYETYPMGEKEEEVVVVTVVLEEEKEEMMDVVVVVVVVVLMKEKEDYSRIGIRGGGDDGGETISTRGRCRLAASSRLIFFPLHHTFYISPPPLHLLTLLTLCLPDRSLGLVVMSSIIRFTNRNASSKQDEKRGSSSNSSSSSTSRGHMNATAPAASSSGGSGSKATLKTLESKDDKTDLACTCLIT